MLKVGQIWTNYCPTVNGEPFRVLIIKIDKTDDTVHFYFFGGYKEPAFVASRFLPSFLINWKKL